MTSNVVISFFYRIEKEKKKQKKDVKVEKPSSAKKRKTIDSDDDVPKVDNCWNYF